MNIPTITIPELQTKDGNTRNLRLEPLMHSNKTDCANMLYSAYQDYDTVQFLPISPLRFKAPRYECAETANDYIKYTKWYPNAVKTWCIKQNQIPVGLISFIAQDVLEPEVFERTLLLLPNYKNQGLGKQLNIISYDIMFRQLKAPAILLQCAAENKAAIGIKNTLQGWKELGAVDVSGKMINPEAKTLLRSQLTRQDYLDNAHNIIVPPYHIQHDYSLSNRMGCE